jgi:1-deoxy-D-xylulose-5-phosphate synthase
MARTALAVAERASAQGIEATVVDPRWLKPIDPALVTLARSHQLVVTIEDNGRVGGAGAALAQALTDAGVAARVRNFGLSQEFLEQGKREALLASQGLGEQELARAVVEEVARLEPALESEPTA